MPWGAIPKLNSGPFIFLAALWAWAILALSGYWRDFEQYSYGYFVPPLMGYFVWRRLALFAAGTPSAAAESKGSLRGPAITVAVLVLPLEYLRLALPASRWSVWTIALIAILFSLALARSLGGARLMRAVAFPLFFFLTAAPWLSFIEKRVTLGLMEDVAGIVTEILHLCGIQAIARGTLIDMRPGTLGIAEACSGIRSLQSGLMYAFAVGELFLLSGGRRALLVVLTVFSGFILNLVRTFILAYQTDLHGLSIIPKIHDEVGIITSLVLPLVVWGLGRLLAPPEPVIPKEAERPGDWIRRRAVRLPKLSGVTAVAIAAFLPCHIWLFFLDSTVARQTTPYFIPRVADARNGTNTIPADVWDVLDKPAGGYLRRVDATLPMGRLDGFYLFWEPRKDNYNVTWHHPERCMVGAGWRANGESRQVQVEINGTSINMLAFPWKNESGQVLQLWGAWRNGSPVIGNKSVSKTSLSGLLNQLRLFSKGNSATEIVSITVPYQGDDLPTEKAREMMPLVFDYKAPKDVLK